VFYLILSVSVIAGLVAIDDRQQMYKICSLRWCFSMGRPPKCHYLSCHNFL